MTVSDDVLDRLAPALPWEADWGDVLRRAGEGQQDRAVPKRFWRRRLIVALVVLAAILVPLAALAATNDWWFLKSTDAPRPVGPAVVVKTGDWGGHAWQLVAYASGSDGLCVSVAPKGNKDVGTMGCSPFVGVPRTPETKASPDMAIMYLSGSGPEGRPAYIVGPVIEKAAEVEIRFANDRTLRVPTFDAPTPLEHVRFYATGLSQTITRMPGSKPFSLVPKWVAGLDETGKLVACLAPLKAIAGISPLSDCR